MRTRLAATLVALVLAGTGTVHASPPVQMLIGQQLQTCNAGAPLSLTVMDSLWWNAIQGNAPPAQSEWLIVFLDVTNPGVTEASAGSTLTVSDDQGREFVSEDPDGRMSNLLADFFALDGANAAVAPGATMPRFALFAVAEDAQALTLTAGTSGCA